MEFTVRYQNTDLKLNLKDEVKKLIKCCPTYGKKVYLKDVGEVRLTHHSWGIAMAVFDKSGKFISNMGL